MEQYALIQEEQENSFLQWMLFWKGIRKKEWCSLVQAGEKQVILIKLKVYKNKTASERDIMRLVRAMKKQGITSVAFIYQKAQYQPVLSHYFRMPDCQSVLWNMRELLIRKYAQFLKKDMYTSQIAIIADQPDWRCDVLVEYLAYFVKSLVILTPNQASFLQWKERVMTEYGIGILHSGTNQMLKINLSDDKEFIKKITRNGELPVLSFGAEIGYCDVLWKSTQLLNSLFYKMNTSLFACLLEVYQVKEEKQQKQFVKEWNIKIGRFLYLR